MALETLIPDAILAQTNLTGVVGDIDDDPEAPDANELVATANNVDTDVRTSFATPADVPTPGSSKQEFKAEVTQFDEGQTGTPDARIELWEDGLLVRAGTDASVGTGSVVITLPWDANELATTDGSLVEAKVVGSFAAGGPTVRNSVNVGAVEWNAETGALASRPRGGGLNQLNQLYGLDT